MSVAHPTVLSSCICPLPYQEPLVFLQCDPGAIHVHIDLLEVGGASLASVFVLAADSDGGNTVVAAAHLEQCVGAGSQKSMHLLVKGVVVGVTNHIAGCSGCGVKRRHMLSSGR